MYRIFPNTNYNFSAILLILTLRLKSVFFMKKWSKAFLFVVILSLMTVTSVIAQCSICTKTAAQLGEKPARALNSGIIYLMLTPFAIVGFIGYQWWKNEKENNQPAE